MNVLQKKTKLAGSVVDLEEDDKSSRSGLPEVANEILIHWFLEHGHYTYPTTEQNKQLSSTTGLAVIQIRNSNTFFVLNLL